MSVAKINKQEILEKIKDKYKKLNLFFSILSVLSMLAYPVYAIIVKKGNLYVNIAVLAVSIVYGILWLVLGNKKKYKMNRVYKWSRLLLTFVSLCINGYSIYVTMTNFNLSAIIMSGILTSFWIANVVFNILYDVATYKFNKYMESKKEDFNEFKDKIKATGENIKQLASNKRKKKENPLIVKAEVIDQAEEEKK